MRMIVLLILLHIEKLLFWSLTASLNAGMDSRSQWWTWVRHVQTSKLLKA